MIFKAKKIHLPSPIFGTTQLTVRFVHHGNLSQDDLNWFTDSLDPTNPVLGLDTEFLVRKICLIQISSATKCLLIKVTPCKNDTTTEWRNMNKKPFLENLFSSKEIIKTGAEIWQDVILLYDNFGYQFNATYDITAAFNKADAKSKKGLFKIFDELFPGNKFIKDKETSVANWKLKKYTEEMIQYGAFDALVSYAIGRRGYKRITATNPINMESVPKWVLKMCADMTTVGNELDDNSGRKQKVDHTKTFLNGGKKVLEVSMDRFRTRIRRNHKIVLVLKNGDRVSANVQKVVGKIARLNQFKFLQGKFRNFRAHEILRIEADISDDNSMEYDIRNRCVSRILRREFNLEDLKIIQALYGTEIVSEELYRNGNRAEIEKGEMEDTVVCAVQKNVTILNDAQNEAFLSMLGSTRPIEIIQGPPGTGKTTVIAHALDAFHRHICGNQPDSKIAICTARGNIAVRNIAQACVKWGFHNFRLVVSKEFYKEWHEAQYAELEDYVLTSDQLDNSAKCRELEDCSVILCTVSMLHSDIFHQRALYKRTVTMLIVDEASQTHIGSYIPPLVRMGGLKKAVFIGDDKQLPPYGSEKIRILSVFDVYHPSHFLGTQYRLPRVIGDFVSQQVYNGRLQTHDGILGSPNHRSYIRWINVVGQEKAVGTSFENQKEAIQIVQYAQRLELLKRRYVILVPYDKQRHVITSMLKTVNIAYENRVFNVDSYQGQECDIVIVGVTRTRGVGFLEDERRTNVLLTRCTKAMVIVGHLEFVKGKKSKNTLLGRIARQCERLNVVVGVKVGVEGLAN